MARWFTGLLARAIAGTGVAVFTTLANAVVVADRLANGGRVAVSVVAVDQPVAIVIDTVITDRFDCRWGPTILRATASVFARIAGRVSTVRRESAIDAAIRRILRSLAEAVTTTGRRGGLARTREAGARTSTIAAVHGISSTAGSAAELPAGLAALLAIAVRGTGQAVFAVGGLTNAVAAARTATAEAITWAVGAILPCITSATVVTQTGWLGAAVGIIAINQAIAVPIQTVSAQ